MASYKLTGKYETLLDRLSQDLSISEKRKVSRREALERILDIVIEEENLFSTKEQAVGFFNRTIFRVNERTKSPKTIQQIIDAIEAASTQNH